MTYIRYNRRDVTQPVIRATYPLLPGTHGVPYSVCVICLLVSLITRNTGLIRMIAMNVLIVLEIYLYHIVLRKFLEMHFRFRFLPSDYINTCLILCDFHMF